MDTLIAMRSFVRVVETGSFSAVAKEENTTQATISKRVAALEASLETQLLIRGSRVHQLTESGQSYYERVTHILREVEEAESDARSLTTAPKGKLRVTVPMMFGNLYIAPEIPEFLSTYPKIQLDMKFSEEMLDLVKEGIDLAIRLGDLKDSSMQARRLGSDELIFVASPKYLAQFSTPQQLGELTQHNCLVYSLAPKGAVWSFSDQPTNTSIHVTGNFQCDTGFGIMDMLLAGAGLSFIPSWLASPYIKSGELVHILKGYYRRYPISAVYPNNRYIPLKTRCFLNFIDNKFKANPIPTR